MPSNKVIDFVSPAEAFVNDEKYKHVAVFDLKTKAQTNALSQDDVDRYQHLSSAFSGVDIPLEVQLLAWDNHGEPPSGIELDKSIVGDMSVIDWLREVLDIRERKRKYGLQKGVVDPEDAILEKQRLVVIYTRCALEIAEAEAIADANDDVPDRRMVYFPAPDGAKLGKNGYIRLFPNFDDSPVGQYRGDGAAFVAQECVDFINTHNPEILDEFLKAIEHE